MWQYFMDKFILAEPGAKVKEACVIYQIFAGVVVGIEEVIHVIRFLCQQYSQEGVWGFLLIDMQKSFNGDHW